MGQRVSSAAGVLGVILWAAGPAAADLRDQVSLQIAAAQLGTAIVAVSVRDAETGAALVAINADELLIPASNMKLLTTGAALHTLGADFAFRTRLQRDGDRLIVTGDGDPGLGDPVLLGRMAFGDRPAMNVHSYLDLWVERVVTAGLKRVSEIVVDDRIFDRRFVHPEWPVEQLNRRYCAEVSGLNFHLNILHFYPKPGPGGRPDLDLFRPHAPWLEISNKATIRAGVHDQNNAWIARRHNTNLLTFYGNVKFPYRVPVPVTTHDMPAFFARLFAVRLIAAGVEVGNYRVADDRDPPASGQVLGPILSTPISTALVRCNRDSQNLYAECLLKRIGFAETRVPGSWANGRAIVRLVVRDRLADRNLAARVDVSDGSGLSRANRVAAATLTAWLNTFHYDEELGPIFIDSLARAGVDGTLARRFRDVNLHGAVVQAKSGYIRSVSCLSGYVTMADGRRRSFSILINGLRAPDSVGKAKKMQEQIVAAIALDMAAATTPLTRH